MSARAPHPTAGFSLDAYDHVLLDMNGTFVLDFDDFGAGADFAATYARLGFGALPGPVVQAAVRRAYEYMAARYVDPAYYDRFPTVGAALAATGAPTGHAAELTATFAEHELGHVPPGHVAALRSLAARRPLSLLSNLWAPPRRWRRAFATWGIADLFQTHVFSSEQVNPLAGTPASTFIKPHPGLFAVALARLRSPPRRVLYVGDRYERDVVGAAAAGMDCFWLHGDQTVSPEHAGSVGAAVDLPAFARRVAAAGR